MNIKSVLKSSPFLLILTIFTAFYLHESLPYILKQIFLSISLSIKELLVFMIPFIIFTSVYSVFARFQAKAFYILLGLIACVVLSNFLSVNLAGIFSYFTIFGSNIVVGNVSQISRIEPLWNFNLPKFISNDLVLLSALILAYMNIPFITKSEKIISKIVDVFLKKFFIPTLPLFVFGFMLKMLGNNIIGEVLSLNTRVFVLMLCFLVLYLGFLVMLAIIFYHKPWGQTLKNLSSPTIAAFTSMSSAAALPFSIIAAQKNTNDKDLADIVMPATANIHMIGDSLCIPIMAMMMLLAFHMPMPTLGAYLFFAAKFTWTKFSGAGVPGGSILVMIPVLESTLGFTPEMTALITVFYMLIDPITTTGNVIGNNIFVIHFHKIYEKFNKK